MRINKSLTGLSHDVYCCGSYIQPSDSPIYTRQPDLDLFSILCEDINKYKKLCYILITGDLNARVGDLSDCPQEPPLPIDDDPMSHIDTIDVPPRQTMDHIKNAWGNHLLNVCFVHDLCLLNGRTLGDLKGQPTFFSNKGNSKKMVSHQ